MDNIVKACKHDHVPPFLQALDWLLVQVKIDYNLSTICHNFFPDSSPAYLSDLVTVRTPSTQLHSSTDTWILRNPYDNALSLTVLQSNGILSLLTSVTFNLLKPSKLRSNLN